MASSKPPRPPVPPAEPAPTPTQQAGIQPAKGTPPNKQNTTGRVENKTEPAPSGSPTNPPRPWYQQVWDGAKKSALQEVNEDLGEAPDPAQQPKGPWELLGYGLRESLAGAGGGGGGGRMGVKRPGGVRPARAPRPPPAPPPPANSPAPKAPAPAPKPASATGSGGAYIKARPIRVRCFRKNTKGDPKEYDKQLADQEKGLNDLTVKEYLEGRQKYQEIGRKGTGAAQAQARAAYNAELQSDFKKQLNRQGITGEAAQQQATQMASERMSTLAALHNPDMIAGGKDVVSTMGDKGVNSSIGSQWKGRVGELDKAAMEVPEHERATTKMNAKLKRCR